MSPHDYEVHYRALEERQMNQDQHVSLAEREPAITIGAITAAVAAVLALLVAFGVELTQDQQVALLGLVSAVGPIVAAILTRRKVTPTSLR